MVSKLKSFFQYSLKTYPVMTNVSVYSSLYIAADLSQQVFNKIYMPEKPEINYGASMRIACVGGSLYAPTLYYWYRFLDRKFPGVKPRYVVTKVLSDQFLMTPILLASFFVILAVLEGKNDYFEELKQKYWTAFKYNQCFWIPGQTINFCFIPPHLRVVYVSAASFIWINVLCFIKRENISEVKLEK